MFALEMLTTGVIGGVLYGTIEIIWRGHTHWTMLIAGGIAFMIIYLITTRTLWPFWQKWIGATAAVVTVEFTTGVLVNLRLGWAVWDYSSLPYNLYGQISLLYSFFWLMLVLFGMWLSTVLRNLVFQ